MPRRSAVYRIRRVLATVFGFVGKEIIVWGGVLGTIVFIVAMVQVTDLRWWQIALMVPLWWLGLWLACLPFAGLAMLVDPRTEEDMAEDILDEAERYYKKYTK